MVVLLWFQLVYLSQERVSMGNLPLFSQERQVVFVTNRSGEHTVSFEWHVTCKADSQVSKETQSLVA